MKTVYGNLITLAKGGHFDVIMHGCNCFNVMGGGIAAQIKGHFPDAEAADCETARGHPGKLGTFSFGLWRSGRVSLVIVNAYTQFYPGPDLRMPALQAVFQDIALAYPNARIGYPRIGAGIGGGHWPDIAAVIDKALEGLDHTLVEYA